MIVRPHGLLKTAIADISGEEMAWLANGEDVLRKLGLTLACICCLQAGLKTGAVVQGANDSTDEVLSVTCGCRRLRYRQKAPA